MTLGPQARVFLDGAYAEGKESEQASLDLAFRYEVYVARQTDRLLEKNDLSAPGVNFKRYF